MHRGLDGDGTADFIEKIDCLNFRMPPGISPIDYSTEPNNPQIIRID